MITDFSFLVELLSIYVLCIFCHALACFQYNKHLFIAIVNKPDKRQTVMKMFCFECKLLI